MQENSSYAKVSLKTTLLLPARRYMSATPLLHLGTTGSTLPLDHCRYTARWKPTIVVTSLEDGWGQLILIWLMWAIPVLRGWPTLLNPPHVCVPVHIMAVIAAPQSPFQHTGYPTLRSVEELADTSTIAHTHSPITTLLVRLLWTAPMFQACLWHMAVLETIFGPLQQGCQKTTATPAATAPVPPPILVQLHLHLWETTISVSQQTLGQKVVSGTSTTLCGTHRGVQVGALAVIVVDHGSLPHWARKRAMTLKWECAFTGTPAVMQT